MREEKKSSDPLALMKIAGAVLCSLLLLMLVDFFVALLTSGEGEQENAYTIAIMPEATDSQAPEELVMLTLAQWLATADIENGAKIAKKCVSCHVFTQGGANRIGPALWGIVDRAAGVVPDFAYSSALMERTDLIWTFAELDQFLLSPRNYLPGTKMSFGGLRDPGQRADLLVWMAAQSDTP